MKKMKGLFSVLLAVSMAFAITACGGGGDSSMGGNSGTSTPMEQGPTKTVKSLAVETMPVKTEYFVGEAFDPTGGTLKVTYTDGTSEVISLTAEGVELGSLNTSVAGTKSVTVRYGKGKTTIKVTVSMQGFKFTYDMNYDGGEDKVENVSKNVATKKPADPKREGYTFYAWYVDEACTVEYDFKTIVSGDTTVYAAWKEEGATYYEVTYDMNYYGVAPQKYAQIVKEGEQVKTLGVALSRVDYSFNGWYTDANATVPFTASAAISADTTLYAGWTKTKSGASTYIFEAEYTDLTGKTGPGYSGSATGAQMICPDTTSSASNGKYVSYLYKMGIALEFYIASDEDTTATLTLSLSEEFGGITISDETWQIRVYDDPTGNDYTSVKYGSVTLSGGAFSDKITVQVSLKKGYNMIQLYTNNSVNPAGEGNGTFEGTAPNVDCIKLTTDAVLIWDANYRLPIA